jgi:EpsD family peptidyl-prolyl cis-trans isomerase
MVLSLALLLLVPACSRHDSLPVAKVNGAELSLARYRLLLAAAGEQAGHKSTPAEVMDRMIDRELFAQVARARKLEREPGVAIALEEAKDEILAQAYVQSLATPAADDAAAVSAFYDQHPELFARRRVFRVFELAVGVPDEGMAALSQLARQTRNVSEVAAWARKEHLPFNAGGITKGSERIAPQLLARLESMREGDIAVMAVPGGASVVQLLQSEPAPLSREEAAPMIRQLLQAGKSAEVAERERQQLRASASIEVLVDVHGRRAVQRAEASAPAERVLGL